MFVKLFCVQEVAGTGQSTPTPMSTTHSTARTRETRWPPPQQQQQQQQQ